MTDHHGYVLSAFPVAPVNETDMVLLPEGLNALKKVAKMVGLDLGGAYLNLDAGFDSTYNRKMIFNAGMIPGSVANFNFGAKIRQSRIGNSMTSILPNARKSKFATEPLSAGWRNTTRCCTNGGGFSSCSRGGVAADPRRPQDTGVVTDGRGGHGRGHSPRLPSRSRQSLHHGHDAPPWCDAGYGRRSHPGVAGHTAAA
jgi:hypothetical protein